MNRVSGVAAIAFVLVAAAGCGSHAAVKRTGHNAAKRTSTAPSSASTSAAEKALTKGGLVTGTCPKSIAATCVPGRKFYVGVCVGPGRRTARTPTLQDLRNLDRERAAAKTELREGKRPKRSKTPATLSLHMLPNGKVVGSCNYGGGPPPAPAPLPASIAGNY